MGFPVLATYFKKIALVMMALSITAGLMSLRIESYPMMLGTAAVAFMALNALAAIYPLYMFRGRKNPFNVYMMGMTIRMAVIGVVLILVITLGGLSQNTLLSITLTAMVSFIAYLAVEIHHFLRHNASLMSP